MVGCSAAGSRRGDGNAQARRGDRADDRGDGGEQADDQRDDGGDLVFTAPRGGRPFGTLRAGAPAVAARGSIVVGPADGGP